MTRRYAFGDLRIARQAGRAAGLNRAAILVATQLRLHAAPPELIHVILACIAACRIEPKSSKVSAHQPNERADTVSPAP